MSNEKKTEELDDEQLNNVQAAGGKGSQLLSHELTHLRQGDGVSTVMSGNPEGVQTSMDGNPEGIKKTSTKG